jgi:hypothetical protein
MWENGLIRQKVLKRILKKVQVAKNGISHTFKMTIELRIP